MSRIFRSDDVAVGDRVVVRQRRGEHASDIIGHVVSLDPLVIRPQEVGGFPSAKEAIEVANVHIIKKLSPRTVRTHLVRVRRLARYRPDRLADLMSRLLVTGSHPWSDPVAGPHDGRGSIPRAS